MNLRGSEEGVAFAAVRGDRRHDLIAFDQVQLRYAFAQLTRFRMAEPHPVAGLEGRGGGAAYRGLDLAGAFVAEQL